MPGRDAHRRGLHTEQGGEHPAHLVVGRTLLGRGRDGHLDPVAEDADDLDLDDDELDELDSTNDNDERDDEAEDIDLEPLAAHNRTSDNPESLIMADQPRSFEPSEKPDETVSTDEKPKAPPSKLSTERQLDHGLKETFPASDPVSINPGAD